MEINFSQVGKDFAVPAANTPLIAPGSASNETQTQVKNKPQESAKTAETVNSDERVLSDSELSSAVEDLSDFAKSTNRQLNFSIDEGSAKQVVKVTDAESGEVIRQIPSEEILRLSERLRELQTDLGATVGILFNKQV